MSQTILKFPSPRSGRHNPGSEVRLCFPARVNFIKLQQKVKHDKNVLFARFGIPYSSQGHSEGSKVNLGGLRGHLLHTETFLVVFCGGGGGGEVGACICFQEYCTRIKSYLLS